MKLSPIAIEVALAQSAGALAANGMARADTIVQVNDLPGTEFWIIRKMFTNAISYAAALGL